MALAVVHVGGQANTASDTVTSDSWASTSGSLLVAIGHTINVAGPFASTDMADSKSGTWTLAPIEISEASVACIGVWYQLGGTRGAAHTVTFNPAGVTSTGLSVVEITGHDTGSPYDTTTDATSTDTTTPFTVTAAGAISGNQIAIYAITIDASSDQTWTAPGGYSLIMEQGAGSSELPFHSSYKLNETGTPAPEAGFTFGASNAALMFVTLKEAVASGFTNTVVPFVSGGLSVGGTVTANPGTWSPTPGSYTYYWHRADDAAGTNQVEIGATGATYTLAAADSGKYVNFGVIPHT